MATHNLIESKTKLQAMGITSLYTLKRIISAIQTDNGLQGLLKKVHNLTAHLKYTNEFRHAAKHYITTTAYTHITTQRKCKIAKDEFQNMLQVCIIHPSSTP